MYCAADRQADRCATRWRSCGTSNGTPFYDALARLAMRSFMIRRPINFAAAVRWWRSPMESTPAAILISLRRASRLLRAGVASYFIQVSTEDYVEDRLLKDCQDDGRLTLSAKQLERFRRLFVPSADKRTIRIFAGWASSREWTSAGSCTISRVARWMSWRGPPAGEICAATLQEASAAFAQVANEIGTQYSLGYYPSDKTRDGRYRQIKVEVRGVKDASVRARDGYYAPKQ